VTPFPLLLAWREGRAGLRRVGLYGLSIALGVAALVSVHSFRQDVARSIEDQARTLLGGDVELEANRPFPDSVGRVVDSLRAAGVPTARVVTAVSMVAAPRSGAVRLLQVRAADPGWPLYGSPTTSPEGAWDRRLAPDAVVVDPAVLTQLEVALGDSLAIGESRYLIVATVDDLPGDLGFQTALGPRVWLGPEGLAASGVLGFGSLARYQTYLRVGRTEDRDRIVEDYREVFRAAQIEVTTADARARSLTRAVGDLGRFLGLVGLGALLLGGLGVASAIRVFVQERLTQVAVLRCIGASQNAIFTAYVVQAAALGLAGSVLGAGVGVAVQHLLPGALAAVLPVDVTPAISWWTVAAGVGTGVWVAVIFALLPLLAVRNVPPLRALRQDVEGGASRGRGARMLALGALAASVVALAVIEASTPAQGLAFAAALAVVTGVLWGAGRGVLAASRRLFPRRAPYPLRQGFSNLFRPGNQTVGLTLALGFGAFVVGTVAQVQGNLGRALALDEAEGRPTLLFFDIQADQREGVLDLLSIEARDGADVIPLVPARLAGINGRTVGALAADSSGPRPRGWALRREYRHTWRADLSDAEVLVAGAWWPDAPAVAEGLARVSVEEDLARDLAVGLGDTLTWSVGGRDVSSVVTSLRRVDWQRFQTNFFVVFEPGSLDEAPATWVALARVEGAPARADVQRRLVDRYPNVSVLDVSRVQEVVEAILVRARQAMSFLAALAIGAGLLVLAGALATSRHQRALEGALLRTLGARRNQLLAVLFSEFLALGTLATLTGLGLALVASWALVAQDFGLAWSPRWGSLVGIWAAIALLTLATGLLGSRGLLRRPPLPLLRGTD
jgi:putative ABC transport system permease protein